MTAEFVHDWNDADEHSLRSEMVQKLRRGCEHGLLMGVHGVCSTRVDEKSFLITPDGMDNELLTESDLVLIHNGAAETGKHPAYETALHAKIYQTHPDINAAFSAIPPHVMAFAASRQRFETSTVPESYYMLRAVPTRPFAEFAGEPVVAASVFSAKTPVVLFENCRIVTTGDSLFTAFDRMEVAEATAASIITAKEAGDIVYLNRDEIQSLITTFQLES